MRATALLPAALCLVACAAGEAGPPEIAYGLEECDHCRMIISEKRHAAAVETAAGETLEFDDLGCLLAAVRDAGVGAARVWVHDVETAGWLDARAASFVVEEGRSTPMGSGVVALSSEASARERGGPRVTVYDWKELVASGVALRAPTEENRG